MSCNPILYWPFKKDKDADYQMARKVINARHDKMPEIISDDLDVADVLAKNPGAVLYYPVFCESTGWWGELLGTSAQITEKLIISPECQLMAIESTMSATKRGQSQLLAAEIYPTSNFFKKMNSSVATVADMLATDCGTILALFAGKNRAQFVQIIESTGNSYLGCIGRY